MRYRFAVIIIGMLVFFLFKSGDVFAQKFDGFPSESEKKEKQVQVEKTETLNGRYYICDETGASLTETSISILKSQDVFSAGDQGKKTVFTILDDKCDIIGGVGYISIPYCLSKTDSKIFDCQIVTNKITGCAGVGIQKTDCREIKIARFYPGNSVGFEGKYYSTTKDGPLVLDMEKINGTYDIRIPMVENYSGFVESDFSWQCTGCENEIKFFHVKNEPTVASVSVGKVPVLGLKSLTIDVEQKNIPEDFKKIDSRVKFSNSLTVFIKPYVDCQARLIATARCNDDTNQENCKKLCAPNGDKDYCYYLSRNKCVDIANVTITPQDKVNWFSETNYAAPEGYSGPLPPCAFSGTCRKVNQLVELAVNAANWVFGIMGSVAFLFFVYGGFMMIFSMGVSDRVTTGKNIIIYAVIGMVISLTAYMLINFLLNSLGVTNIFRVIK